MEIPLNICVITQQLKNIYSGPGTYSSLLINKLLKIGHNIHVILPKNQLPNDIQFTYQEVPNPKINSHARWIELSFLFNQALKTNETRFDLIHFTDIRDSYFVNCKYPMICNINDTYITKKYTLSYLKKYYTDWFPRFFYYGLSRIIEKSKINKSNLIIANSNYTKSVLLKNYPKISKKIFVCYKTIDFSRINNNYEKADSDDYNILFVGGNMERKGIISIINSAPEVIKKLKKVKYHIIGNDPKSKYYIKLCENLGISSHFNFYGNLSPEKLSGFYKNADLFLMPSIDEALGIVFLEAMANNVPVIGSNVGGIPEIIVHNENGILVEPNNIPGISKSTIKLLTNYPLRTLLINNAKNGIVKFSNDAMFQCTFNLYSLVLNKKVS